MVAHPGLDPGDHRLQDLHARVPLGVPFDQVPGGLAVEEANTYKLTVSDIPPTARGGAVLLTQTGAQLISLTDGLRDAAGGEFKFSFDL